MQTKRQEAKAVAPVPLFVAAPAPLAEVTSRGIEGQVLFFPTVAFSSFIFLGKNLKLGHSKTTAYIREILK